MGKGEDITTRFRVDISDLKKGITEANKNIKLANAQFKAASEGMDDWSKSSDGINLKLKQLNSILDSQKSKLESYRKQQDRLEEGYNENGKRADELRAKLAQLASQGIQKSSDEYKKYEKALISCEKEQLANQKAIDDLKITILNQQAAVNKTEKEIKGYTKTLGEVEAAEKAAAKSGKTVEEALKDIQDGANKSKDSVKELDGGFTVLKGTMASLVADGIKNLVSGFINLAGETREYRTEMGKLETAFGTAKLDAEDAKNTYEELYGVLADEGASTEAAQHLAKISKSEKDLEANTKILTGVFAEYGSSIPTEGLAEGMAASAAMGEVQGVLADALEWQGVNLDNFNEKLGALSSEEERAALIQETLTDLYGDSAEAYRKNNKELIEANKAQASLTDVYADFGEKAEPIITTVKQGTADLLTAILELVDGVDFSKVSEGIKEGFNFLIDNVLPAIKEGFGWIKDNSDYIIAAISGVAAAFIAWKAIGVATMIKGMIVKLVELVAAQEGATVAQKLLNLAMKANLIGIIITAITGLVTAFVLLWKKSDSFRQFWINLWEKIKAATSKSAQAIANFFSNLWTTITEKWQGITSWFSEKWQGIVDGANNLKNKVTEFFTNAKSNVVKKWQNITSWFSEKWQGITDGAKKLKENVVNFFKNAWSGVTDTWDKVTGYFKEKWQNIKDTFSNVKSWFSEKFGAAWQAIKDKFSGWSDFWGGLWTKVKNKFSDIGSNIGSAISDSIKSGINGVLGIVETAINKGIGLINKAIKLANKLPGVSVGTIDTVSLPRLYQGAVVKRGKPYLLEGRGDEAVVPLHNNKKWIHKTAQDMLSELKGGSFNEGSSNSVVNNYNFTQNNTSPKALSRLDLYRQTKNQFNQLAFSGGGRRG